MLDDLVVPGPDLTICGTATGRKSASKGLYYAGRGNKFWKISIGKSRAE
jgi:TDG/mug DNA glycosylase family protein